MVTRVSQKKEGPKGRKVHVLNRSGSVQEAEDVFDLPDLLRTDALAITALEQAFKPFMTKAGDHEPLVAGVNVTCNITCVNKTDDRA